MNFARENANRTLRNVHLDHSGDQVVCRSEAIRRLIEIALTNKAKRQSNRGEK
jgi:hypothetical protein